MFIDYISRQKIITPTMSERSENYTKSVSYWNFWMSYDGSWRFKTDNITLIKSHVNREVLNPLEINDGRSCSLPSEDDPDVYSACVRYNSGDCRWNSTLSRGKKLNEFDQMSVDNIKKGLQMVKPLPFTLNLFHGFELNLNYGENHWKIGSVYNFPFFLSKTLSWKVATFFAAMSCSNFYQKYMLCKYLKPESRHICLDVRRPHNDEYEFLSCDEKFKYVEKIYHIGLLPWPTLRVYYVMEYV